MGTIKDEAEAYKPKTTKNISELTEVPIDLDMKDSFFEVEEEVDGKLQKKKVDTKIVEIDGEEYRVPLSVLKSLKVILEDDPGLQKFKVMKIGTGFKTEYTVIPIYDKT